MKYFEEPLSNEECVQLDELLSGIPEACGAMSADYLDGFLTAVACLPKHVAPSLWMPYVFGKAGGAGARLPGGRDQELLEDLVYRRYRQIEFQLSSVRPIDPIIFEDDDEEDEPGGDGNPLGSLQPFAAGFYEAVSRWPGILDTENDTVAAALHGVLRHLPEELLGDFREARDTLDLECPLEDLDAAIEDLAESVAEIASVTRGFTPKAAQKRAQGRRRPGKNRGNQGGRRS